MKWLLLICIVFLTGCTDNRIRINPVPDIKISPAKQAEYRLYVTRALWAQKQLKDYEERK
ncbi:hypothetical protein LCGC14_0346440 [marine sediment metagenome]|uniref:Uncharacterized protein n=1 Tax=marine sediment metagenome TaxID=412755 RepID=A0A0F9TV93_9ZZZZ